jgi:CHAT domain-containing protein/tetratricopeptide (TPR) repeat protein
MGISAQTLTGGVEEGATIHPSIQRARELDNQGKHHEALHFYQQAYREFLEGDNLHGQADVMSDMAVAYRKIGESDRSLFLQQQAVATYKKVGDLAGQAKALRRIGVLYRHVGNLFQAIAVQEEALDLLKQHADAADAAMLLTNLGTIYGDLGRLDEARRYFERALNVYTQLNDQQGVSYIFGNLGQLYLYLGESRQALQYLEQSLSLKRAIKDRRGQANALLNIGTVYRSLGDFQQALTFYYQASDVYQALNDQPGTAVTLGNIGSVYEELGDLDRALEFHRQALELKKSGGTPAQVTVALANLASLAIKQQRFEEAASYLQEGMTLAEEQDSLLLIAHIHGQFGTLYLQQEQFRKALDNFSQALKNYEKTGSQRGRLEAYMSIGQIFIEQQALGSALEFYTKALQLASDVHDSNALWKIKYQLGQLALHNGDKEHALKYFMASVETLEQMRSYLEVPELRRHFLRKHLNPYPQVIELLLQREEVKEALIYLERFKARTFLEVVAHGEPRLYTTPDLLQEEHYVSARIRFLREKLSDAGRNSHAISVAGFTGQADERKIFEQIEQELHQAKERYEQLLLKIKLQYPEYYHLKIVDAEEVRQLVNRALGLIESEVVVLEYFFDDGTLHTWIISDQQQISHVSVPVPRGELLETVLNLRTEVGFYFSDRVYPVLHTLYDWLLAPVEHEIAGKSIVGIVPFQVLHFVPFAALTRSEWIPNSSEQNTFPEYVIEEYAMFSLPSLSMLPVVRERHRERGMQEQRYVLGIGNATENLPGAEQEIRHLARQFSDSAAYTGLDATKERLFAEAGAYEVIHVATHGVYDKYHPMFSYLELATEALYAREIFGLRLRASLVTLSGCETLLPQRIDEDDLDTLVSGDELVGFVRAFLYAGTPSVVSSLWRINDAATQYLMQTFYQHLPQLGKVSALQHACQAVIRKTLEVGRRKSRQISLHHPFFWSSFVLMGDWK